MWRRCGSSTAAARGGRWPPRPRRAARGRRRRPGRAGPAPPLADLGALGRPAAAMTARPSAIAGAALIDATGAAAIDAAVVIVRAGRLAAAGARATTPIPGGMTVIDGRGQTVLPGLW